MVYALKPILVGFIGCGTVAVLATNTSFKSSKYGGSGLWERAVHIISKSSKGNVKLFAEEEVMNQTDASGGGSKKLQDKSNT